MSTHPPTTPKPPAVPSGMDHDALPPGTRFGEFEILRVLGVGGFGIVYLAYDHSLEREVALKEYMPASLAARGLGPQITVRSSSFAETYAIGLRSFINEARLLARFDHPSLVKVYRFWEDNATAYMVMPFLQGVTLRDTRRAMAHPPDEAWIRSVITPILSALELLHREGVYHRDIAPDNILLPPDGPPVLLDFGAARRVISGRTQSLTAILKPSYAPIEQYAEMTQLRQGPWTDLYALGAVIHYLLFGAPPAPATARAVQDDGDTIENRIVPGVSPRFLEAVSWMLSIRPIQRPQNGEQLRAVLDGLAAIPPRGRPGITIPGVTASAAVPEFEPTRVAEPVSDATRVNTAFMPTHLPTAHAAPPGATFSPKAQMPTARVPPSQFDAPTALGAAPSALPAEPAPGRRDAGPAARPAALPPPLPGQRSEIPAAVPRTRPAAAAAEPARGASAKAPVVAVKPRSAQAAIAVAAGLAVVAVAALAGWQLMARRDGAAADTAIAGALAASSPVAALAVPAPASPLVPPRVPTQRPAPIPALAAATPPAPVTAAVVAAPLTPSPTATAASGTRARAPGRPVPRAGDDDAAAASLSSAPSRPADPTSHVGPGYGNPSYGNPSYGAPATNAADRSRSFPSTPRDTAVAQRPVPQADAGPASAREACGKRVFIALAVCMDAKCEEPPWRNTAECVSILARKTARENR